MDRRERLIAGLDLEHACGLEIGPLANPVVKKSDGTILYVDYADADRLRKRYFNDPHVDISKIVTVDALWGEKSLYEALDGKGVDYIIASHVIEHVPDLVTWFGELHSVLLSGGVVRLAIPDKRYEFDYLRSETRLCDVLSAYLVRARVPQPHEIIDFCVNKVEVDTASIWREEIDPDHLPKSYTYEGAMWLARDVMSNGTYHDVHCWVFTPYSFAFLCMQLAEAGLLNFSCESFHDTEYGQLEFFVALVRSADQQGVVESWRRMMRASKVDTLNHMVKVPGAVSSEVADSTEKNDLAECRLMIRHLRLSLEKCVKASEAYRNSTSWRITSPLRWIKSRLQRLS
jgi:hypothetical protein